MSGLIPCLPWLPRPSTPLAYAESLYFFREHVDVVRRRILRRLSDGPDAARPGAAALRVSEGPN
ncbi:MAG: hypothetical protein E6J64_13665 [Deltaproteobacteria bacterium]|nr:MAG: hypothetical protein E6J64_13665 [Deltaproteobacteria bacterium]